MYNSSGSSDYLFYLFYLWILFIISEGSSSQSKFGGPCAHLLQAWIILWSPTILISWIPISVELRVLPHSTVVIPSLMTFKDLKALHTIIGTAIAELEARFEQELGKDFDYPSLDAPYENTGASQVLSEHPSVVSSANRIIAAADHLIAVVRSPFNTIVHSGMAVSILVRLQNVCGHTYPCWS